MIKITLTAIILGCICFWGVIANANATQGSLVKYINQITSAKTVKAYLSTNPHNHINCSFSATSISNIEQLKKVLQISHLKEVPELESHLPVVGLRLEFKLSNDNVIEVLFGKEYYGEGVVDGMVKDTLTKAPVYFLADRSIYRDIYYWIRKKDINAEAFFYAGHYPLYCEKWKSEMGQSEESFKSCLASRERETLLQKRLCEAIKHKNFYQTSEKQVCDTPLFRRSVSDLCPSGWK